MILAVIMGPSGHILSLASVGGGDDIKCDVVATFASDRCPYRDRHPRGQKSRVARGSVRYHAGSPTIDQQRTESSIDAHAGGVLFGWYRWPRLRLSEDDLVFGKRATPATGRRGHRRIPVRCDGAKTKEGRHRSRSWATRTLGRKITMRPCPGRSFRKRAACYVNGYPSRP